jgi:uncharacterized BrkB/YihY/UPF0761 family membrane protein
MFSAAWKMLKDTVLAFIDDEALSRGAAIAFYTVTSIAPILLIVIAIAGLAVGRDAAQNALTGQLSSLMWVSKPRRSCNPPSPARPAPHPASLRPLSGSSL